MKRILALLLALTLLVMLTACGSPVTDTLDLLYESTHTIDMTPFDNKTDIQWTSDHPDIVAVTGNSLYAAAPGTAMVTGLYGEKIVAEYAVNVEIIPVTAMVLSTNTVTIKEAETYQLSCTLFPENASRYGLSWQSADVSVAIVDDSGLITALKPGQTTISISNKEGFIATCSVTVLEKPAYDQLTEDEQELVDLIHRYSTTFYNPSTINVRSAQKLGNEIWYVYMSGQNRLGGNALRLMLISPAMGGMFPMSDDTGGELPFAPNGSFQIDLINEAIQDVIG